MHGESGAKGLLLWMDKNKNAYICGGKQGASQKGTDQTAGVEHVQYVFTKVLRKKLVLKLAGEICLCDIVVTK